MKPVLTVGMAHVGDFTGVWATIQSIRTNNDCSQVEFLVINNGGPNEHAKEVHHFLTQKINGAQNAGCRFVNAPDPRGTSAPRDRIFKEAQGEFVLVCDAHLIWPGPQSISKGRFAASGTIKPVKPSHSLAHQDSIFQIKPEGYYPGPIDMLNEFFRQNPDTQDLYSGPLLYDTLDNRATHFDDYIRGEMVGIWGWAWQCPCGMDGLRFTPHQPQQGMPHRAYGLFMGFVPVTRCGNCEKSLPTDLSESNLRLQGYTRLGEFYDDPPFEIPGMGLGAFACKRDAWLGFNEHARGFGGEEMYIHEKFRMAGRKAWCLPFLPWNHRFSKVGTIQFQATLWNKVRNYVLEWNELGKDLAPIYQHFVTDLKRLSQADWDYLVEDPIKHSEEPKNSSSPVPKQSGLPQPGTDVNNLKELFTWMKSQKRDLEQHADKLYELASKCNHVTEISTRREGTIALLAGLMTGDSLQRKPAGDKEAKPVAKFISYNTEFYDGTYSLMKAYGGPSFLSSHLQTHEIAEIEETDLLFIDTIHTGKVLAEELRKFGPKVRKYIVMHDTKQYADRGEDGKDGMFSALQPWLEANPTWFPVYHAEHQYGLTVLSCDLSEWPDEPIEPALLGYGPGSELKILLRSFGVEPKAGCDCTAKQRQMDKLGVVGCRKKLDMIVGWMREGAARWKWDEMPAIAARAVVQEPALALKLGMHLNDPWPVIIEEVIKRAEVKQQKLAHARAKVLNRQK